MKRFETQHLPMTTAGLCLILAPLFSLGSSVVAPAFKSDEGAQLDVIAQHPTRWYWFTLLLLVGSLLLIPALLGIAALARDRSPRLATIGGGLAVFGSLISIGDVMSQFMSWQMVARSADHAQMAQLLARFDNATGVGMVFSVGGLAVLIGTVMLTVALVRGRVVPAWAAVGLSAGAVMNVVGFSAASAGVVAASWVVLLAAMGFIGRVVLAAEAPPRAPVLATPAGAGSAAGEL
jgi:hypothetical protein